MSDRLIPCTHTGSLPRPDKLIASMWAAADGVPVDQAALTQQIDEAVTDAVRRQVAAGITVVNDGEMSKPSYATYVQHRLSGFGGHSIRSYYFADLEGFPRSKEIVAANPGRRKRAAPACTGPIAVSDLQPALDDVDRLVRTGHEAGAQKMFSSAASPGVISLFFGNEHYPDHESYVFAIAEAMRAEYEAIAAGGLIVQLDCPDLAMGRHSVYAELDDEQFRRTIAINLEALDYAVANIPREHLRMHLCWGNYPGPHHCDVPITTIIDLVWKAKPMCVLFEGANPRHAHEWEVLKAVGVPDDKVICPGVIEPQSNYIEHPEVVSQRLQQWATVVDPERLMAGVDCGFSVHVGMRGIDPDVAWAKLESLAQGCDLASKRVFG